VAAGTMSVALTNAIDTLRPRRLFDGDSEDLAGTAQEEEEPEFALFHAGGELGCELLLAGASPSSSSSPALGRPGSAPPVAPSPPPLLGDGPPAPPPPLLLDAPPSAGFGGGGGWSSPSPLLPPLGFEAASAAAAKLDAFRGLHNDSPGLALAVARAVTRDPASSCASSCATPSRAPLPLRPPTPGAPGSNVRRTTSFMDGLDESLSPGVDSPERVPMSLTDTALMQLTQSLTSISLGPSAGAKRPYDG
jgi:hypothetical protein